MNAPHCHVGSPGGVAPGLSSACSGDGGCVDGGLCTPQQGRARSRLQAVGRVAR